MVLSSSPSRVTPRGFIDAASTALPVRVRFTRSHKRPITTQQTIAVKISFFGVRTPKISTTPSTIGSTVLALLVKKYAISSWIMMPHSRVAVRMKISFSSSRILRVCWRGRTISR